MKSLILFFRSFLSKILLVNYLNHNGTVHRFLGGGSPIKNVDLRRKSQFNRGEGGEEEEEGEEGRAVPFLKHFLGLFWTFFLSFPLENLTFFRSKLSPWFTTFFSRSRAHSLKMVHGLARAGAHQPSNIFSRPRTTT